MPITIAKVQNGSIALPKIIRKSWQGAQVVIVPSPDSLYLKRITRPTLAELEPKLRQAGKLISDKDIDEAVKWARKQTY